MQSDLAQDLRFAFRALVRARGFLVAAVSLGLAVGATVGVYGTADWLLSRSPTGVVDAEALVGFRLRDSTRPHLGLFGFSYPQVSELARIQRGLIGLGAYGKVVGVLTTGDGGREEVLELVTGDFFATIGLRAAHGRLIGPADDETGRRPVAVLSHAVWLTRFRSDPDVLGSVTRIDGVETEIVGVAPRDYEGFSLDWNGPTGVWLPVRSAAPLIGRAGMLEAHQPFFRVVGRLDRRTTQRVIAERASTWLARLPPQSTTSFRVDDVVVQAASEMRIAGHESVRSFLGALLVVCGLVMMSAAFNVANFALGRTARRDRELALRSALGAAPGRIARMVITEAGLFSTAVGFLSAIIAFVVVQLLSPLSPIYLGLPGRLTPASTLGAADGRMMALALAGGSLVALASGLAPLRRRAQSISSTLQRTGDGWSWARRTWSARQVVLAVQVALAVAMSVAAGSTARAFMAVRRLDPEVADPTNVLLARVVPVGMTSAEGAAFYEQLSRALGEDPTVASAALGANLPFRIGRSRAGDLRRPDAGVETGLSMVGPGYFTTVGTTLLGGTEFIGEVGERSEVIVNAELARRLWPGEDAVGRTVSLGAGEFSVRGVVSLKRCESLMDGPSPCLWLAFQNGRLPAYVTVRGPGPVSDLETRIESLVTSLDPRVALTSSQPLGEYIQELQASHRAVASIASLLALFALLLVVFGCVSLFSSLVSESRRDLSIRIALGARPARIVQLVAGGGAKLILLGTALGLAIAWSLAPLLASRVPGLRPHDPMTYLLAAIGVAAFSLVGLGHAVRLARQTEPARSLRAE